MVLAWSAGLSLLVAAGFLTAVPKLPLALVASGTAIAISGFSTVGRPVRSEAASTIAVALVGPLLLLLVVKVSLRLRAPFDGDRRWPSRS